MSLNPVTEKHYRVAELAELWGYSLTSITTLFRNAPGVLKLSFGKKVTLSIPESVALRVHETLTQEPLKLKLASSNPRAVVNLRDSHAGVIQKPRHVLKSHPPK